MLGGLGLVLVGLVCTFGLTSCHQQWQLLQAGASIDSCYKLLLTLTAFTSYCWLWQLLHAVVGLDSFFKLSTKLLQAAPSWRCKRVLLLVYWYSVYGFLLYFASVSYTLPSRAVPSRQLRAQNVLFLSCSIHIPIFISIYGTLKAVYTSGSNIWSRAKSISDGIFFISFKH